MKQDFFTYVPSELIINILSRLPVRTIMSCKCVRKSWRNLLETNEFVESHIFKSVSGLVFLLSEVFEFEDELDLEHHELRYKPVTKFDYNAFVTRSDADIAIQGTASGLLLLVDISFKSDDLYICNPITRDCIEFQCPKKFLYPNNTIMSHGYGTSKITGQHKVVTIFHGCYSKPNTIPKSDCHVYTLGTGSWRIIDSGVPLDYSFSMEGLFFNGNLHWLVSDSANCQRISCLDLETEQFTILSSTPGGEAFERLFVLADCLCLCDTSSLEEIVIWLMKEYGVEKSWTMEFVIEMPEFAFAGGLYDVVRPIKVFEDGDILIAWEDYFVFYYSNKTKTSKKIDMFELHSPASHVDVVLYNPSFLSLKSFGLEKVSSF